MALEPRSRSTTTLVPCSTSRASAWSSRARPKRGRRSGTLGHMIVVIGAMSLRGDEPDGLAARTAAAAAKDGSRVELISKVGDDPTGDALLLALARANVGHVAVLRDTAFPTERSPELDDVALDTGPGSPRDRRPTLDAADVGLALRYLGDYRVAFAVHPSPDVLAEASAASRWMGARL